MVILANSSNTLHSMYATLDLKTWFSLRLGDSISDVIKCCAYNSDIDRFIAAPKVSTETNTSYGFKRM